MVEPQHAQLQRFVKLGPGPKTISPSRTWGLESRQCQRLENTNTNKTVKKLQNRHGKTWKDMEQLQFLQLCFTFRLESNIFSGGVKRRGFAKLLVFGQWKIECTRRQASTSKVPIQDQKTTLSFNTGYPRINSSMCTYAQGASTQVFSWSCHISTNTPLRPLPQWHSFHLLFRLRWHTQQLPGSSNDC